jgi:lysophospholipase L1-like esterase
LTVASACLASATLLVSACSDSPATPTPVLPPPLGLTCPGPVSQLSPTGQPIGIRYGGATATGGTPPVQITCTPASDTLFQVGRTTVTCNAADTKGVTASCSFVVTVTAPPTISLTRYVAFGDSITAGEITVAGEGGLRTLQVIDALSYPTDLRISLVSRYTAQSIRVDNAGIKGESTNQGLTRLPGVLGPYQVLLLLEGANDINNAGAAMVLTAVSNVQSMVRIAKSRGLRVFLGTLPPQNPVGCNPCRAGGAAEVQDFNARLKIIATAENVPLVDVYAAFNGDLTLLGPDGLHPTAGGYQTIANAFFNTIKTTLEIPATSLMPSSLKAPFVVAPWRR